MSLTKRVELMFDPEDYARLEEIARSRGESVAALIRRAVESYYLQPDLEKKHKAVQYIISQETDFGSWEEVKEAIGRNIEGLLETP